MKFSDYLTIFFFADAFSALIVNNIFGPEDFVFGIVVLAVMAIFWKVYENIRTPEEQ
jgi:hypothetical protein